MRRQEQQHLDRSVGRHAEADEVSVGGVRPKSVRRLLRLMRVRGRVRGRRRRRRRRRRKAHGALELQIVEADGVARVGDVHVEQRPVGHLLPREGGLGARRHLLHDSRVLELGARRLRDEDGVVGQVVDAVGREARLLKREDDARLSTARLDVHVEEEALPARL